MTTEQKDKMAVGRQRAAEARRANQEAAGIPDSRPFGGTEAENPLLSLHVGGVLVADMVANLSPATAAMVLTALSYQATDEGIAERNDGKQERRATVGDGPFEKSLQKRKDDVLERGMDTFDATNPMQEVLDANQRPGFRRKFLADEVVKRKGLRGWQPVVGKNGEPVTLGTLKLAEMPEAKAVNRNKHFKELADVRLEQVQKEYVKEAGALAKTDQ